MVTRISKRTRDRQRPTVVQYCRAHSFISLQLVYDTYFIRRLLVFSCTSRLTTSGSVKRLLSRFSAHVANTSSFNLHHLKQLDHFCPEPLEHY
jgi:hypothetical protein